MLYWIRDKLNADLYEAIDGEGDAVLDVGGGNFIERLQARGFKHEFYVVLEPLADLLPKDDPSYRRTVAEATALPYKDESFDLILAIQVLEHVFDPIQATKEMYRCLRPGGRIVILVPQSGTLHLVPHHYQNLTRFWLFKVADSLSAEVLYWKPIGGAWRTLASRLFLMFTPIFGGTVWQDPKLRRRGLLFWITLPLQIIVAALMLPFTLVLSLTDIKEEANNHLFVMAKSL